LFGGLDRLTVETSSTGLAALAGGHADIAPEQIMHPLPAPVLAPAPEVLVHHLPGWKIVGQQTPRTAAPEEITDRLQEFTVRLRLGPPTGFSGGHQRLKQGPLAVTESGGVWFAGCHAPM
jgi:hypothetical protein